MLDGDGPRVIDLDLDPRSERKMVLKTSTPLRTCFCAMRRLARLRQLALDSFRQELRP